MPNFAGRTNVKSNDRSPMIIPTLMAWWDASRLPVINPGFSINAWPDASGNGYDFTSLSGQKAAYQPNVQNGLPVARFDGTDDIYTCTKQPTVGADNWTMFLVAKSNASGVCAPLHYGVGGTGGNGFGLALSASTDITKTGIIRGGIGWHASTAPWAASQRILMARRQTGTMKMWVSGGASVLTVPNTSAPTAPGPKITLGGHDPATANLQPLDFCEGFIYNKVLSDGEANYIGAYLNKKWNVPWASILA